MCNRFLSSNWPPNLAPPPTAGTPGAGWQLQWWSGAPRCVGRLQGCQIAFRLPNGHVDSLHQRAAAARCLEQTPLLLALAASADYQLRSCASDSRRGWHQVRCVLVSHLALLGSSASNMPPLSATKPVHTRTCASCTRGDICSCCSCRRLLRLQDLHDHYSRAGQRSPGRSLPAQVPRDSERVDEVSTLGVRGRKAGRGWVGSRTRHWASLSGATQAWLLRGKHGQHVVGATPLGNQVGSWPLRHLACGVSIRLCACVRACLRRYSLLAGGKRVRPALCLAACQLVGGG